MMRRAAAAKTARDIGAWLLLGVFLAACGGSSEPPPGVALIEVSPANDTLLVGETVQLTTTLRDENDNVITGRTVTWVSTSPSVASVSGTGLVTGVGDGTTTIVVSADGVSSPATIRVFGPCSTASAPPIAVGQTINGALSTTDCRLTDNTFADGYALLVTAPTNVQIDLAASFDTYLVLFELLPNSTLEERAVNDDIDPDDPDDPNDTVNTNSRIVFSLQANSQYFVLANSFDPNVTGNYQLGVAAVAALGARSPVVTKTGKAPVSSLIKALRVR